MGIETSDKIETNKNQKVGNFDMGVGRCPI